MQAVDMLYLMASAMGAMILLLVIILLKGCVPKKGHLLKEKAIQAGCVADGVLESSKLMQPGWDEYNHRFDKAYYRAVYVYMADGRRYKYKLSLEYSPKEYMTIYYDPDKPKRAVTDVDVEWKMGAKYRFWALLPLVLFFVIYLCLKQIF